MSEPKRVLVVDDEQKILDVFSAALKQHGHRVDVAENGRLGFRLAALNDYDLIIFDLRMPEWNGIDAIKALLLVRDKCKFLVVSGYAETIVADELRDLPEVVDVLSKPVELHNLLSYVEQS
jgi:two-component system response regulator AtoC